MVMKTPIIGNGIIKDQQMIDLDGLNQSELNQMLMTQKSAQQYSSQPQVNSPKSFNINSSTKMKGSDSYTKMNVTSSQKLYLSKGGVINQLQSVTMTRSAKNANSNAMTAGVKASLQKVDLEFASPLVISQMRPKSKKSTTAANKNQTIATLGQQSSIMVDHPQGVDYDYKMNLNSLNDK